MGNYFMVVYQLYTVDQYTCSHISNQSINQSILFHSTVVILQLDQLNKSEFQSEWMNTASPH